MLFTLSFDQVNNIRAGYLELNLEIYIYITKKQNKSTASNFLLPNYENDNNKYLIMFIQPSVTLLSGKYTFSLKTHTVA